LLNNFCNRLNICEMLLNLTTTKTTAEGKDHNVEGLRLCSGYLHGESIHK